MTTIEIILSLISEKGINKSQFLSAVGLNQNSFVNWTNRGTSPSGDALAKIADYFGVSVDYLLGRTDVRAVSLPADALEVAAAYDRLPTVREKNNIRFPLDLPLLPESAGAKTG